MTVSPLKPGLRAALAALVLRVRRRRVNAPVRSGQWLREGRERSRKPYVLPDSVARRFGVAPVQGSPGTFVLLPPGESRGRIFYIHGGGFRHAPSVLHWRFLRRLCNETGCQVRVPVYPKTPFWHIRDAMVMLRAAWARWQEEGEAGTALMGDSAGGTLALLLLQWLRDAGLPLPAGTVLLSPCASLTLDDPETEALRDADAMLELESLRTVCAQAAWPDKPDEPGVSPAAGELGGLGQLWVFAGTRELLYPDALLLERRAGAEVFLYPGMGHTFPLLPGTRQAADARRRMAALLRGLFREA